MPIHTADAAVSISGLEQCRLMLRTASWWVGAPVFPKPDWLTLYRYLWIPWRSVHLPVSLVSPASGQVAAPFLESSSSTHQPDYLLTQPSLALSRRRRVRFVQIRDWSIHMMSFFSCLKPSPNFFTTLSAVDAICFRLSLETNVDQPNTSCGQTGAACDAHRTGACLQSCRAAGLAQSSTSSGMSSLEE